jgi:uncharacterized protein
VNVAFDVPARMRDGMTLRANVYRPDGPGPWPVLLARTPYSKDDHGEGLWCGLDPVQTARAGFMVVVQDVRGRFASDGTFDAYRFEARDGHDTVEWAARLPGSNGRVGMYSGSYCGNTQWLAAGERPPSLAAISPALTWSEPFDGLLARGGAVELGLALRWAMENGADALGRLGLDADERAHRVAALAGEWDRLAQDGYRELPVPGSAVLSRHGVPELGGIGVLDRPEIADWCRVSGLYERVEVPSLHTAGWYDIFAQGTLDNYAAMAAVGKDARLVVGPWTHQEFGDPIGELLFGVRASRDRARSDGGSGWGELQLAWLRRQLDPEADVELPQRPVRIFVMGRNEWRDESGWPLQRARTEHWFLGADGSLAPTGSAAGAPSELVYDPADPVPTAGGNGVLSAGYASGPVDQADVEARPDVLVFTSEPLAAELEVTGRVTVVLHAESSAPSADWVARLCDVHPDGRSFNLCDGIVRIAQGADALQRVEIDLWSTSNVFLPGHRLRVHVTSSSFPRWDRNLNTGDQRTPHFQTARQRVHHDASWIELPVV